MKSLHFINVLFMNKTVALSQLDENFVLLLQRSGAYAMQL